MTTKDTQDTQDTQDPYEGAGASNTTEAAWFPCQGVDVSANQGAFDWDAAITDGNIKFAFARASIGYGTEDKHFATNWAAMAERDILRGAYHFGYPESIAIGQTPAEDAQQEANYFCDLVLEAESKAHGGQPMYDGKTLPPVLDYEQKPSLSSADQRDWVNAWISTTQQRLKRGVIIYSGPNVWSQDFDNDPWLTGIPLWVARYNNGTTPNVTPWTSWVMWQWSGGGKGDIFKQLTGHNFPGVPNGGAVDVDAYWGSLDLLKLLGNPSYDRWLMNDTGTVGVNPYAPSIGSKPRRLKGRQSST